MDRLFTDPTSLSLRSDIGSKTGELKKDWIYGKYQ